MINAALSIKRQKLAELPQNPQEEKKIEDELWKVVARCLEHVQSPNHTMQLGNLLTDSYEMVLRLGRTACERIQIMRKRHADRLDSLFTGHTHAWCRQQPIQHLAWLQEEQVRLQALRKQLPPNQQAELEKLQEQVDTLPTLPSYDPSDANQYDSLVLQIAQQMVNAVLHSKRKMEERIAKIIEMKEQDIAKERNAKNKEILNIVDYCLEDGNIQNPNSMQSIAQVGQSVWR